MIKLGETTATVIFVQLLDLMLPSAGIKFSWAKWTTHFQLWRPFFEINSLRLLFIFVWAIARLLLLLWVEKRKEDIVFIFPPGLFRLYSYFFLPAFVFVCGAAADWRISCNARASTRPPRRTSYVLVQSSHPPPPFYFLLLPSGTISSRRREIVALAQTCANQDICEKNCRARLSFVCSVASPPNPVLSYVGVFGLKWTNGGQELCAQIFFFFNFFIFFLNSGFKNRFLIICATWGTTGAAVIKHMQCAQNKRKYLKN